jgi:hypothetical protein
MKDKIEKKSIKKRTKKQLESTRIICKTATPVMRPI